MKTTPLFIYTVYDPYKRAHTLILSPTSPEDECPDHHQDVELFEHEDEITVNAHFNHVFNLLQASGAAITRS